MSSQLGEVLEARITVRTHQPGGPHFIDLMHDGALIFAFGPYIHPGVAKAEAARLREFIALVIEVCNRTTAVQPPGRFPPHKTTTTLVTKNGSAPEPAVPKEAGKDCLD